MATKIAPPDPKITRESNKAALAAKALEQKHAAAGSGKKKLFDPRRDPKSYTQEELIEMMKSGEIRTPNFSDQNLAKFAAGEITWAELTGLTMQDAYSFAQVAYNCFEQGKYDQAQTIVEGLVISNPYDAYFHSLLGSIYGRKGMHEEAQEEYSIAIELNAKDLPAHVNRAEILLQRGEIEKALMDLKKAIELDPKGEQPFGVRARALAQATVSALDEAMREKGLDPQKVKAKAKAKKAAPAKAGTAKSAKKK